VVPLSVVEFTLYTVYGLVMLLAAATMFLIMLATIMEVKRDHKRQR
jgi:hypothetical protein